MRGDKVKVSSIAVEYPPVKPVLCYGFASRR
jgi:hypothetical protein